MSELYRIDKEIIELLESESKRINHPDFIKEDPIQFPRKFRKIQDIEIISFLSAILAWGNRKMICRDIDRLLKLMDNDPYLYLLDEGYEELNPSLNIHRTFFARDLQYFMRGLREIYRNHASLDEFALKNKIGSKEEPAWEFVKILQNELSKQNNGATCSRCLPVNLDQTALKRINMALRWLVRDDGIVDMGIWKSIPKNKLFIPLDVHVGNVSRELGLLERKANDKKSVLQLTELLRQLNPEDPVVYDFALFGIGVEGRNKGLKPELGIL